MSDLVIRPTIKWIRMGYTVTFILIIALAAVALVIPLFRGWLRWETGEWLARHPYLAWAILGVIWWTCLAPKLTTGTPCAAATHSRAACAQPLSCARMPRIDVSYTA